MKNIIGGTLAGLILMVNTSVSLASEVQVDNLQCIHNLRHSVAAKHELIIESNVTFEEIREKVALHIDKSSLAEDKRDNVVNISLSIIDKIEALHTNLIGASRENQREYILGIAELHKNIFVSYK